MFLDIDRQLREMGIGDLGVGKRIKRLAASLYGRFAAYDDALDHRSSPADSGGSEAPVAIAQALRDNLYATAFNADDDDQLNDDREGGAVGGQDALAAGEAPSGQSSDRSEVSAPTDRQISQMASYVHRADRAAELLTRDDLLAGRASFPIP